MRRIHIGLNVKDLDASVHFYSDLFGAAPSLRKDDSFGSLKAQCLTSPSICAEVHRRSVNGPAKSCQPRIAISYGFRPASATVFSF